MKAYSRTYQVNGIDLHVIEKGHKGQPVIIFLHGFPEFWYGWQKQMEYFAEKGFHVIVPDQRGYNMSSKPQSISSYRITTLAEDILQLIHYTGREKVYLVGHDWGGAVAWTLAYLHPELLNKVIILNMPHPRVFIKTVRTDMIQMIKSWYIGFFQLPVAEKFLSMNQYRMIQNSLLHTSLPGTFSKADLQQYRQAWQQPEALHSMINWYRAAMHYKNPFSSGNQQVKVPLLLIWGEKDKFLQPKMAQKSLRYCQNGRLHLIKDATHWLHHEKSSEVNKLIYQFIQDQN
ncbi:alpha/beta hydrolase [Rhodocytophaga rosea]|uniref:Alpha/beta hydrolase n=1 Tax=Rhodocytophaga rosea TaxID=2704465 RepID=A0A6C0GRT2_9BACT|nr:alpha/beta hydrolase [Rhodocytophaga rosea]QHT70574.1 alpha/beta hydrolase [Rhodocytophaga rosea]